MVHLLKSTKTTFALCLFLIGAQLSFAFQSNLFQLAELEYLPTNTVEEDADKWTLSAQVSADKHSLYGTQFMLGGPSILGVAGQPSKGHYFERTYEDLPAHDLISFRVLMKYSAVDSDPTQYLDYMFDDTTIEGETISSDAITYSWVKGRVRHSGSSLRLRFLSKLESPPEQKWFGFNDLDIAFANYTETITEEICAFSNYENNNYIDKACRIFPDSNYFYSDTEAAFKRSNDKKCYDAFSEDKCLRCRNPYFWNGIKCSKCPLYCVTCMGVQENYACVECIPGYTITKDGTCGIESGSTTYIVTGSEPSGPTVKTLTKSSTYIEYLDIPLPENLQEAIAASSDQRNVASLQFGIPISSRIEGSFTKESMPAAWANRGIHSSFLVNFWEQLMTLIVIVFAAGFFTLLTIASKKMKWQTAKTIFDNLRVLAMNFFLIMMGLDIPDIIFFAAVEIKTLHLRSTLAVVSFIVCLIMLALTLAFLAGIAILAKKSYQAANERDNKFIKRWEGFQIFYNGFKPEKHVTQFFYLFYITRMIISAMLGTVLYTAPIPQAALQVILNITIIALAAFTRPFTKVVNLIQVLVVEGVTLITNLCVFGLTIAAKSGNINSKISQNLGDVIIVTTEITNLLFIAFLINKLTFEAMKIYEQQKGSSKKSRTVWMQLIAVLLQQGGMGFEEILIPELYSQEAKPIAKMNRIFVSEKAKNSSPDLYPQESSKALEASALTQQSPGSRLRSSSISPKKGFLAPRTVPSQFNLDDDSPQ